MQDASRGSYRIPGPSPNGHQIGKLDFLSALYIDRSAELQWPRSLFIMSRSVFVGLQFSIGPVLAFLDLITVAGT
jgi:hypothetical protein